MARDGGGDIHASLSSISVIIIALFGNCNRHQGRISNIKPIIVHRPLAIWARALHHLGL
jgi:hypothetical protein